MKTANNAQSTLLSLSWMGKMDTDNRENMSKMNRRELICCTHVTHSIELRVIIFISSIGLNFDSLFVCLFGLQICSMVNAIWQCPVCQLGNSAVSAM